jgi:hypothetical protein
VKANPILKSNSIRADTASTWRSSKSMGFLAACRICLHKVSNKSLIGILNYSHSLDITKPCTLDGLQPRVTLHGFGPYFTSDVFSFSVTIGPDKESFCPSGLLLDVRRYCCLTLSILLVRPYIESNEMANLINSRDSRSVKETFRRRIAPVCVSRTELNIRQMTRNASHNYTATSPWLTEIKVEGIVLYVSVTGTGL